MLPETPRRHGLLVADVLHGPDVTAWRQALIDILHDAHGRRVLSLDVTMKIAMGLRRYETMIPHREEGVVDTEWMIHLCLDRSHP